MHPFELLSFKIIIKFKKYLFIHDSKPYSFYKQISFIFHKSPPRDNEVINY